MDFLVGFLGVDELKYLFGGLLYLNTSAGSSYLDSLLFKLGKFVASIRQYLCRETSKLFPTFFEVFADLLTKFVL